VQHGSTVAIALSSVPHGRLVSGTTLVLGYFGSTTALGCIWSPSRHCAAWLHHRGCAALDTASALVQCSALHCCWVAFGTMTTLSCAFVLYRCCVARLYHHVCAMLGIASALVWDLVLGSIWHYDGAGLRLVLYRGCTAWLQSVTRSIWVLSRPCVACLYHRDWLAWYHTGAGLPWHYDGAGLPLVLSWHCAALLHHPGCAALETASALVQRLAFHCCWVAFGATWAVLGYVPVLCRVALSS
jgi:hypothetical protein